MQQANLPVCLSVVVPVYRGADYLSQLMRSISDLRRRWEEHGLQLQITEVICVLDAPVDESRNVLQVETDKYPWLRLLELSQNSGQHNATVAGILYSSGDWVVTLDEDLQHNPPLIERLLAAACREQADVIYAAPETGVHGGPFRNLSSRLAKWLVSRLSGNRFVPLFNSFRLIRGDVARAASSICAQNTYFDVALTWFTDRIATEQVGIYDRRHQSGGRSGYRLWQLVQHAKRLMLTTDIHILRFTTIISVVMLLFSLGYAGWVLYSWFFLTLPPGATGWTSLMMVMLGFGGLSIFMLGLIAEFLHKSMLQLQGRPVFFVVDRSLDAALAAAIAHLGDK